MHKTLWTRNFTLITLGTIVSAIGGTAMSFALSYVVFDQSGSTLLAGIFTALSMIPTMVLPILAAPYLDRFPRKPLIVGLDTFNGVLYLLFGLLLFFQPFNFVSYMFFSLIVGSTSTIYQLAYTSLYPNLIPEGFAQKGYTVSGMIYPTASVVVTPIAGWLYTRFGLAPICVGMGCMLLFAASFETAIRVKEGLHEAGHFSFKAYWADLLAGLQYLRGEKGLLRIYTYMPITQGLGYGSTNLIIAYFNTTPGLGAALYAFFTTAEFVGRTLGGLFNYLVPIPAKHRFKLAYGVYQTYSVMDGILLLLGYPFMLLNRAIVGFLGINSATLRESSVQKYLPDTMRAKMNAVFNATASLCCMVGSVAIGLMGEYLDYRLCMIVVSVLNIVLCHLIMGRGHRDVGAIYNHQY